MAYPSKKQTLFMLGRWAAMHAAIQKMMDGVEQSIGLDPNGPLFELTWANFDAYTAARARPITKLTIEKAREIRLSPDSTVTLVKRYQVDRSLIQGIKAGKRWRDYSNPFAGLMA